MKIIGFDVAECAGNVHNMPKDPSSASFDAPRFNLLHKIEKFEDAAFVKFHVGVRRKDVGVVVELLPRKPLVLGGGGGGVVGRVRLLDQIEHRPNF